MGERGWQKQGTRKCMTSLYHQCAWIDLLNVTQMPNTWDLELWEVQAHAFLRGHCVNTCWLACLSKFSRGGPWGPINTQVHGKHSAMVADVGGQGCSDPSQHPVQLPSLPCFIFWGGSLEIVPLLDSKVNKCLKPLIFRATRLGKLESHGPFPVRLKPYVPARKWGYAVAMASGRYEVHKMALKLQRTSLKSCPTRLLSLTPDILRPENLHLGQVPGDPVIASPSKSQ